MLSIDFETRSLNNLIKCGVYRYADDTSTGIYMLAYKFDDNATRIWLNNGDPFPDTIIDYVRKGGAVYAFNAAFERQIWNTILTDEHKQVPRLKLEQTFCTMVQGLVNGLPGSLENQSRALGVNLSKDTIGKDLIRKYSILNVPWEKIPAEDQKLFADYCIKDVEVERAVSSQLRELSPIEWEDYHNVEKMNDEGITVDLDFAEAAVLLADQVRSEVAKKVTALTNGAVVKITQRKTRDLWMDTRLTTGQKELIRNDKGALSFGEPARRELLLCDDLDDSVRSYLALVDMAGGSTIGKYEAMIRGEVEGRIHGAFLFNAAHTGRASSRLVQLQNMKRPIYSDDEAELLMTQVIDGIPIDDAANTLGYLVRHAIYSDTGMTVMDYSSVEYIVLMWLAGDSLAMDEYARGEDAYIKLAMKMFNIAYDDVTKDQRFNAKVVVLAAGFGGGAGAVMSMAKQFGVSIDPYRAKALVEGYREANPLVVALWSDINTAVRDAVRNIGTETSICDGRVRYESDGSSLWCTLPSVRMLRYLHPKYEFMEMPWGDSVACVGFQNNSRLPKASESDWPRSALSHINGSENLAQAIANDLLRDALAFCYEDGLVPFMMVHDEIAVYGSHVELMKSIMTSVPEWAEGMPLRCDGRFSYIYGK
jgi:DNA polymerase